MRWPTGSLPTSPFFCSDSVLFFYSLSPQKLFGASCTTVRVGARLCGQHEARRSASGTRRRSWWRFLNEEHVHRSCGYRLAFFLLLSFLSLRSLALAFSILLQRRFVAAQRFGDIKKYALSLHFAVNKVGS